MSLGACGVSSSAKRFLVALYRKGGIPCPQQLIWCESRPGGASIGCPPASQQQAWCTATWLVAASYPLRLWGGRREVRWTPGSVEAASGGDVLRLGDGAWLLLGSAVDALVHWEL
jgi:hypothetical protein